MSVADAKLYHPLFVLCMAIVIGIVLGMLDTSIPCSDNECPPDKECFVPSCLGSSCRSVQPICLTVVNVTESVWKLDVDEDIDGGSGDGGAEPHFTLVEQDELRLRF